MSELSSNLKVFLARELQRQFSSLDNSVALFISGTDDTIASGGIANELNTRRQLQTAKILQDSTVSCMIPRVNWTTGTIYDFYSMDEDNSTRNFYVYTTDGNVYACISNGGGRKSIDEPTGTGTSLIYLSNGYVWKFLYKVPSSLFDFVDNDYIPIQELPIYENKPFAYASDDKQLQYAVQYTAAGSVVENIKVTTQGEEYPQTIKASANQTVRESTTETVKLDSRASGADDRYVGYSIRIFAGTGVGQIRKITAYVGATKTATVESVWSTQPDSSSRYEIIPSINISGDGTGAIAYAKMHSYAANTIESVVVASAGTNYTNAVATVTPAGLGTVLEVTVNPVGGIGRDPLFDLNVKRLSILVKMEGRENQNAVLGNDYRQYGLWLSPKIGSGYTNSGKIAGTDAYIRTKVDLEASSGQTFTDDFVSVGDFILGSDSYNTGKVALAFTRFSPTRGQVTVDGLNSKLKNGETIYTFQSNNIGGGYTFTNKTAKVLNTLFEDSTRSSFTETYRCSHKLRISTTDGSVFDPGNPFATIPYDAAATGGSGSNGLVLDFTNINGGSGDLFLTKVVAGSSADVIGFTGGETLAAGSGVYNITSVSPPELNLFSGKMLYINSIEQVTRNTEQLDLFKISFDF